MRRISSLFLAAWMCVGLVGCGEKKEEAGGPALEAPSTETAEGGADAGSDKKEEGSAEKAE